jgi:dephospho-CoA kinase
LLYEAYVTMNLAITGGFASGKSTVLKLFAELGAFTIDTDQISRELTLPGLPLTVEILRRLGTEFAVVDEPATLDRSKLGQAAFRNQHLLSRLERITHPAILETMKKSMESAASVDPRRLIAVEVPLLYEAGLQSLFDEVAVVWCCKQTQMQRLSERLPRLDARSLMERISSQMPLDEKRHKAHYVINSEKDFEQMKEDVAGVYHLLHDQVV